MSDKKIIDDYYSQNLTNNQVQDNLTKDNKKKISIKGKVKIKKEDDLKKDNISKIEDEEKDIIKNKEKEIKSKTNINKDENKIETKLVKEKPKVFKKEYFTKFDLEKDSQTKPVIKSKQVDENKKINKSFSQDTKPGLKKDFGKFSKSSFKVGNKNKSFEDKEEQKNKKFFKKDKTTKYKKIFLQEDEDDIIFSRSNKIKTTKKEEKKLEDIVQNLVERTGETVIIGEILSIKELSEKIGIPLTKLIAEFMKNGMKVNINSKVDFETASIIAESFSIKLQKDISSGFSVEDIINGNIESILKEDDSSVLKDRPPIISIMGHVDHGKTSLLDYIRKTRVASGEAGGITQSIGAYQVEYNGKKITFLDTPGHEAFTTMRARGAKLTDIAVLVVAADEGVKPQTIESINHAKEAGIPIVVAINKIDKPGSNPDFVKGQLAQNGLQPEDWGGDVPIVLVSALTGQGIDDLLEVLLIVAELKGLKANPNRQAIATVIESHLDSKLGPVSTVLINTGTLKKGDCIVCKGSYGRVKLLKDYNGKNISTASPSDPVLVIGLDDVVEGGDIIQVVSDIENARIKSIEYKELMASKKYNSSSSIDLIMSKIKSGNLKQLKIVLKTDTNGSLEALKQALIKLSTPEIKINIIHSGVGNITEGDVLMCQGSQAVLIGYNVNLIGNTKTIIESKKIEYISSKIIYHITERIEKIITGMLDPKEIETILGEASVERIFYEDKKFSIIGLKLKKDSKIEKNCQVRIIKNNKLVGKGFIENLKSGVTDVNELEGPTECGIKLKTDNKVEIGDLLEIYKITIQK